VASAVEHTKQVAFLCVTWVKAVFENAKGGVRITHALTSSVGESVGLQPVTDTLIIPFSPSKDNSLRLISPCLKAGVLRRFFDKSKLVPRFISILGLTASTLILVAAVFELFGVILQLSAWGAILALPVFAYEMTLAVWLITKGFNASPIPSASVKTETNQLLAQHT